MQMQFANIYGFQMIYFFKIKKIPGIYLFASKKRFGG